MESNTSIVRRMHTLLDEERRLLLSGRLDALPALLERKQILLEEMDDQPAPDMTDLQGKLTKNHALLTSAMEGIRRVVDRLETLKRLRQTLETYDSQGHRRSIGTLTKGKVERRA